MSEQFAMGALAPKIDLRDYTVAALGFDYPEEYQISWRPSIKNQGTVGSCVAHATSEILECFHNTETGRSDRLSTDFIYGMQGVQLGRAAPGMYLRDACKIAQQYGDCYDATIPTNIEQPDCTDKLKAKLNEDVYSEAYQFHIQSYAQCKNDNAIKHAIMNYGPVLASIKWYDDCKLDKNYILQPNTSSDYGYHAIMVYGWNKDGWLCQNSWGKSWGKDGTFIQTYENGLSEAWSFVDAKNPDVIVPANNKWYNGFIKVINFFANAFRSIFSGRK